MRKVRLEPKKLDSYRGYAPDPQIDGARALARDLRGLRVLHLNSTSFGGGVAEILRGLVPLMRDVGIDADWYVIEGPKEFFEVTKGFHNSLQGKAEGELKESQKELYLEVNKKEAERLPEGYDIAIIHDPQPMATVLFKRPARKLMWRCHIDTSTPSPSHWEFICSLAENYDCAIFTMREFVGNGFPLKEVFFVPPAIDPLSDKNRWLSREEIERAKGKLRADFSRPTITQVSRFDPWKDPFGVLEIYRNLKEEFRGLQLLMIGVMATDDPEAWEIAEKLKRETEGDKNVYILSNLDGVGNVEVNAAQRLSTIILQKSIREGFGLTVAEAMWKGKPVVGGKTGGIKLQINDGVNGFLVSSVDEAVQKTKLLLEDENLRKKMGERAKEKVFQKFLITRLLLDYIKIFREVLQ